MMRISVMVGPPAKGAARRPAFPPLYRWVALCQLLLAAAVGIAGCSSDGEARKRQASAAHQLGTAYLKEGRPAKALQELSRAEQFDPGDHEIQNTLGLAYWARTEYGLAEEKFRRAVELKADYSEAWNNLGAFYIDRQRYADAVAALQNALKNVYYTTSERALANMGWALYKLGRFPEAERKLREALDMTPNFMLAHRSLGIVLFDQSRFDDALVQFDEAIRLNPNDADSHLRRGMALIKTGDRAAAKAAFEQAWKLSPRTDIGKSAKTYLDLMQQDGRP